MAAHRYEIIQTLDGETMPEYPPLALAVGERMAWPFEWLRLLADRADLLNATFHLKLTVANFCVECTQLGEIGDEPLTPPEGS